MIPKPQRQPSTIRAVLSDLGGGPATDNPKINPMIRENKKENNTCLTSHHLFKGPNLGYKRYTVDYIGIPIAHCRSHPREGNWNGNSPRKPASNLRMARGETCYTMNMTESHHLVRLDCKVSWWIDHIKSEIQPLEVSKQSSPKTKEATTWTRYGHDMGN